MNDGSDPIELEPGSRLDRLLVHNDPTSKPKKNLEKRLPIRKRFDRRSGVPPYDLREFSEINSPDLGVCSADSAETGSDKPIIPNFWFSCFGRSMAAKLPAVGTQKPVWAYDLYAMSPYCTLYEQF